MSDVKVRESIHISVDELNKLSVVQSNMLVQSIYSLNPLAHKIVRKVVSKILPSDSSEKRYKYRIYAKELTEYLNINDNRYNSLAEKISNSIDEAMDCTIYLKGNGRSVEDSWVKTKWFASAEYNPEEKYYEFTFSDPLRKELFDLVRKGHYTQYALLNVRGLSSAYSIRLYELLMTMAFYKNNKELILSFDKVKEMLGIKKGQYMSYDNFHKRVLMFAEKEINGKTNIKFQYEPMKTSKKITHIKLRLLSYKPDSK